MPAQNENYPWLSYYGHYRFFEERMASHSSIKEVKKDPKNVGVYYVKRTSGDTLKIFICECYIFSSAEYLETTQNLGKIDAIVINSSWCQYTLEVKKYCRDIGVGIFSIGDFMAALNKPLYSKYLSAREIEEFKKRHWDVQ